MFSLDTEKKSSKGEISMFQMLGTLVIDCFTYILFHYFAQKMCDMNMTTDILKEMKSYWYFPK